MELKFIFEIIITAACILIFIPFAVHLFNARVNQENENAKNVLETTIAKIEVLKDGQSLEHIIQGFRGSGNWYLVGFNLGDFRPQQCLLYNCLCICKADGQEVNCQTSGFCREIIDRKADTSAILHRDYYTPVAGPGGIPVRTFDTRSLTYLKLSEKLLSISLGKDADFIHVKTSYESIIDEKDDWSRFANPRRKDAKGYTS
jgi:hypothetical protein